jgi:hypothetical protein
MRRAVLPNLPALSPYWPFPKAIGDAIWRAIFDLAGQNIADQLA